MIDLVNLVSSVGEIFAFDADLKRVNFVVDHRIHIPRNTKILISDQERSALRLTVIQILDLVLQNTSPHTTLEFNLIALQVARDGEIDGGRKVCFEFIFHKIAQKIPTEQFNMMQELKDSSNAIKLFSFGWNLKETGGHISKIQLYNGVHFQTPVESETSISERHRNLVGVSTLRSSSSLLEKSLIIISSEQELKENVFVRNLTAHAKDCGMNVIQLQEVNNVNEVVQECASGHKLPIIAIDDNFVVLSSLIGSVGAPRESVIPIIYFTIPSKQEVICQLRSDFEKSNYHDASALIVVSKPASPQKVLLSLKLASNFEGKVPQNPFPGLRSGPEDQTELERLNLAEDIGRYWRILDDDVPKKVKSTADSEPVVAPKKINGKTFPLLPIKVLIAGEVDGSELDYEKWYCKYGIQSILHPELHDVKNIILSDSNRFHLIIVDTTKNSPKIVSFLMKLVVNVNSNRRMSKKYVLIALVERQNDHEDVKDGLNPEMIEYIQKPFYQDDLEKSILTWGSIMALMDV